MCLRISTDRISVRFLMALVQWCSGYVSFLAAPLAAGYFQVLNREQLGSNSRGVTQKDHLVSLPSGADTCWLWSCLRISTYHISVQFLMALVQWCSGYVSFLHAPRAPELFFPGSCPSASPQDTRSPFLALGIARCKPLDGGAEDIRRVKLRRLATLLDWFCCRLWTSFELTLSSESTT